MLSYFYYYRYFIILQVENPARDPRNYQVNPRRPPRPGRHGRAPPDASHTRRRRRASSEPRARCADACGRRERRNVPPRPPGALRAGPRLSNWLQAVISLEAAFHLGLYLIFRPARTRLARGDFLSCETATLETRVQRPVIISEPVIAYPPRNLFLSTPQHPRRPLCSVQSSRVHPGALSDGLCLAARPSCAQGSLRL